MSPSPNVVWLTLESTRQDHTTMGGYRRDTTPNIAGLAERPDGWAFDDCFSHGIWTLSSSASILTGTIPSAHGAGMVNDAIPPELTTVPERLRAVGYHTECISPNPHLSEATDLDRGFDEFTFLDKGSLTDAGIRSVAKYVLNLRRHGGGFSLEPRRHTPDFVMTDLAKRRLNHLEGRGPFFMYLHYAGPHRPYFPPRRFRERYCADLDMPVGVAGDVALDHHDDFWRHVAEGCPFSDAEWEAIRAHYDGEIAHTDELVGDLFDHAADLDLGPTVIIVTGDHGEYFGEEGLMGHNLGVHDAVSNVPLVVSGLEGLTSDDGLVQHVDVVRTLLAVAGADADGVEGVDLRTGRREYAVVQRGHDRCEKRFRQLQEYVPDFDTSRYHSGTLTGLRSDEFKLRHSEGRSELFRLADEDADVAEQYPEVHDRMVDAIEEILATAGQPRYSGRVDGAFSEDMKSQLADLGYLVD